MARSPIGKYSGNKRLDPSTMKEPEADNDFSAQMWLEDVFEDEEFFEEVKEQIKGWKNAISMTSNPDKLKIHLVGQSHIDMAWKWRYEQTRQKGVITFKKAILHAKKFPGQFTYAASEPVLFDWLKEDDPAVYEELKNVVKSGEIELVGGSWVEPDCMMPSGEAFIRQRLYGMRFYQEEFGILPKVEWFLDSFGYNYGLPQILKKSGAEYFWTSKITWNRQTMFPFVNFWWESPDGTRMLTSNFQQGWNPVSSWIRFEIGRHPIKEDGKRLWSYRDEYEDIDEEIVEDPDEIIPPVGIFAGKGDGGHGPTHQEVAFDQAAVKEGFAQWSTAEAFFKALEPYGEVLPVWQDELYLEYHRGTFSVHFEVKRHNRLFQNRMIALENMASFLSIVNEDYAYPVENLEKIWKIVLLNQFHDVLPGSSIPEVYDDIWDMWQECSAGIDELLQNWQKLVPVPKETQLTLSNTLAWKRNSPAFIPIDSINEQHKLDASGKPPYIKLIRTDKPEETLIGQPIAAESGNLDDTHPAGWWVVGEFEAFATKCYKIEILKEAPSKSEFEATTTKLANNIVQLEIDQSTGAILNLSAHEINEGKNLLKGKQSNLTLGFVDDFPMDHAWNIKPEYWKHPLDIPNDTNVKITVVNEGPIFTELQITRILGEGEIKEKLEANSKIGANNVTQTIMLFKDNPEVYLKYEADWNQPWLMLKVVFDTATEAEDDVSDQCYCAIKRSTRPETHPDQARYEKIMHNYVDLSTPNNEWGLALLNEGKYAYDAKEGTMRLTMLRTPKYPTTAAEAWVNKERKIRLDEDGSEPPEFVDLGFLRCRYALYPHLDGALTNSENKATGIVKRAADEFNNPISVQKISSDAPTGSSFMVDGSSIVSCEPAQVTVTSFKNKEWVNSKNKIMRVVENTGNACEKVVVKIHPELSRKITKINGTDLLERPNNATFEWDGTKGELSFAIGAFEILSFELHL